MVTALICLPMSTAYWSICWLTHTTSRQNGAVPQSFTPWYTCDTRGVQIFRAGDGRQEEQRRWWAKKENKEATTAKQKRSRRAVR